MYVSATYPFAPTSNARPFHARANRRKMALAKAKAEKSPEDKKRHLAPSASSMTW